MRFLTFLFAASLDYVWVPGNEVNGRKDDVDPCDIY